MGIFTTSGSTISMTTTTTNPGTFDAAGYGALSYTQIGSVENLGGFGDTSEEVTFDDIAQRRTIKLKGQRNAGNLELVCGRDDTDTGQDALYTAEQDNSTGNYHFKVTFPNRQASGGDDAVRYFSGKVMSVRETLDTANNVAKLEATIGINTAIILVDSTAS